MGGSVGGDRIKVSLLWSLLWRLLYISFLFNNFWLLHCFTYLQNKSTNKKPTHPTPLCHQNKTKFNNSNKPDISYGDSFYNVLQDPNSQVLILDVIRGTLFKCVQYKHTFPHRTSRLLMKQRYLWTAIALVYSFIALFDSIFVVFLTLPKSL